jgi:hypothetical protein
VGAVLSQEPRLSRDPRSATTTATSSAGAASSSRAW